jgi:endoglucanase
MVAMRARCLPLALLVLLGGCMDATGPQASDTEQIKSLTSDPLTGDAGFVLSEPVRVQVLDALGKELAGAVVTFVVTEGGGSVSPAQATTNTAGIAEASWVLGPQPGSNAIKVSYGDKSVTLHATGRDGLGVTILRVSGGTTDSLPAGCMLGQALVAKVLDAAGKPQAGAVVSFEVAGGDGTVDPAIATTGTDGIATTRWRVGFQGGANVVKAVLRTSARPSVDFTARSAPAAPNGFSVLGNKIYDPGSCQPILFHGAARPSLEWWYGGDDEFVNVGAQIVILKSWGANLLRLPVSQSFWLAGTYWNGEAVKAGVDYKAKVVDAVNKARAAGLSVIIDLHSSDRGDRSYKDVPDIWKMPDVNNSIPFWADVASTFKNDGGIIFELYNEPHPYEDVWTPTAEADAATWNLWLNGGDIPASYDYPGDPVVRPAYKAAGMQQLYDVVRGTGARNLVIIGGTHWGYDLSAVPSYRVKGYNIIYSSHPYDWPDKQQVDWDRAFGNLTATDPVMISEFGSYKCKDPTPGTTGPGYNKEVLDYADAKGMSWAAWRFWTPPPVSATLSAAQREEMICSTSSLLTDWDGTPSASGLLVKQRLATYH